MNKRVPGALRVIQHTLIDWWDGWITLVVLNLVWAFCWITVILGPPATFALVYAANELAHGRGFEYKELAQVARQYFVKSWLWALLNFVVLGILIVNGAFYGTREGILNFALLEVSILLSVLWLTAQFYTIPYVIEQEDKRLRLAIQNSLLTTLKSPGFTLIVIIFAVIILLISGVTVVVMFLGGPCLLAILANRAVLNRLEAFGIRKPADSAGIAEFENEGGAQG